MSYPIIYKTAYEEIWYQHQFRRTDGRGWLASDETIVTPSVTITDDADSSDASTSMISNVSVITDTKVQYKLAAGTAAHTYTIHIKAVTSNGQKFEDHLTLRVA